MGTNATSDNNQISDKADSCVHLGLKIKDRKDVANLNDTPTLLNFFLIFH